MTTTQMHTTAPEARTDRQRLLALLRARADRPATSSTPRRRAPDVLVPASPLQQRMWRLEQGGPRPAHVGSHGLRLTGPLDVDRLVEAIRDTMRRHEALRCRVAAQEGQLVQQLLDPRLRFRFEDLSSFPADRRDVANQLRAAEMATAPLSLVQGDLLQAHLMRFTPEDHLLLLSAHLGVFDGWSSGVFTSDVGAFYRGDPPPDPTLSALDVDAWRSCWLRTDEAARRLALVGDHRSTPPVQAPTPFRRSWRRTGMEEAAWSACQRLARSAATTPFIVLLAAAAAVVARQRSQPDRVVLGVTVAGRDLPGLEALIGQFSTVVPVTIDRPTAVDLPDLIGRTRQSLLSAMELQRVGVDVLAQRKDTRGLASHDLIIALHNYPTTPLDLGGVTVVPQPGPPAHHLELYAPDPSAMTAMIGLVVHGERLEGTAEYNSMATTEACIDEIMDDVACELLRAAGGSEER